MGVIKRIHINRNAIASNSKHGTNFPVISVKTSRGNTRGFALRTAGPVEIVYRPDKPLSCGAKLWLETSHTVFLDTLQGQVEL